MFNIPKIEKSAFYADSAMKAMEIFAQKERNEIQKRFEKSSVSKKKKTQEEINLDKRKDLELGKIRYLNESVHRSLRKLSKSFPNFNDLDEIYLNLIDTSDSSVREIERARKELNSMSNLVDSFTQNNELKLKRARTQKVVGFIMKKHLGKVNSVFKKNNWVFDILGKASAFMNRLPKFEKIFTVSISGFPNVGKSTLMKKITGSDVEIQSYPFTTKGLMFGYITENGVKSIQLIDTPGLLGRKIENKIEQRARIVLQKFCDMIIFVFDLTESCGYSIPEQIKLFRQISNEKKTVLIYFSKIDLYNEENEEEKGGITRRFRKHKFFTSSDEIKKYLLTEYKKGLDKFDPRKLKVVR